MGRALNFLDPFGAPEIFVEGVAYREMIGNDIVRSAFYANEHGERIIRVKLLIPFAICATETRALHDFIHMQELSARLGRGLPT